MCTNTYAHLGEMKPEDSIENRLESCLQKPDTHKMVFFHALLGAFYWNDSADRRSTYKNDREREKKSLRISIEMPKNRKYKKEFQVSTMGTKCPESRSLLKKFRKQIDFVCKCLKMKYNINIVYFYFLLLPLIYSS